MKKFLFSIMAVLLSAPAVARVCKLAPDLSAATVSNDGGVMWQVMMNSADIGDFAISGMAFCSSTSAGAGGKGTPSTTAGTNCWCKTSDPITSSWVSAGSIGNVSVVSNVSTSQVVPFVWSDEYQSYPVNNARFVIAVPTTTSLGFCNANCASQCAILTRTNTTFRAAILSAL